MKIITGLFALFLCLFAPVMATDYSMGSLDTTASQLVGNETVAIRPVTSPANTGTLDSAQMYLGDNTVGPFQGQFVVYDVDSNIVDSTANFAFDDYAVTLFSANFIEGASISASTNYLIGIQYDGGSGNIRLPYKTSGVTPRFMSSQTSIPASFTTSYTDGTNQINIIVWYSDGGGAGSSGSKFMVKQ